MEKHKPKLLVALLVGAAVFAFSANSAFAQATTTSTSTDNNTSTTTNATSTDNNATSTDNNNSTTTATTTSGFFATTSPFLVSTASTSLSFMVGGQNISSYTYSLNGAPYSASAQVSEALNLSNLPFGFNQLCVLGADNGGQTQATSSPSCFNFVVTDNPGNNVPNFLEIFQSGRLIHVPIGLATTSTVSVGSPFTTGTALNLSHFLGTTTSTTTGTTTSSTTTPPGAIGGEINLRVVTSIGLVELRLASGTNIMATPNFNLMPTSTGTSTATSTATSTDNATGTATSTSATTTPWNGLFYLPVTAATTSGPVNLPSGLNLTGIVGVIETGHPNYSLHLSAPARILVSGQAGRNAGYFNASNTFQAIGINCPSDISSGLGEGGSCLSNSGNDLLIWTRHLSQFVIYTQTGTATNATTSTSTATTTTSGGGGGSGGIISGSGFVNPITGQAGGSGQIGGQIGGGAVLGQATYRFATNLGVGAIGQAVTELQRRLTSEGFYNGPVTGYFGPLTRAAVIRYQQSKAISATGFVGPLTRDSLNSSLASAGGGTRQQQIAYITQLISLLQEQIRLMQSQGITQI